MDNSPKIERTAESTSTKDKTAKKKLSEKQPEQPAAAAAPPKEIIQETKEKKKKEKKPAATDEAATKTQTKAAADDSGPPVPSMIDLRVGKIVEGGSPLMDVRRQVSNHPPTGNSHEAP